VAAWLAAFAVCVGDLTASILVIPPGMTTIPVRVFGQIHSGVDDLAAGICLVMMLGFSILASLVLLFSTAQGVRGPGSFAFASIIKT
jgi:iron(III) transport system permease protein